MIDEILARAKTLYRLHTGPEGALGWFHEDEVSNRNPAHRWIAVPAADWDAISGALKEESPTGGLHYARQEIERIAYHNPTLYIDRTAYEIACRDDGVPPTIDFTRRPAAQPPR